MFTVTASIMAHALGRESIRGTAMFDRFFTELLGVFKGMYPSSKIMDGSLTQAFSAMEFVLNAEVYFTSIGSRSGRAFFNDQRKEFLKHYNYDSVISNIKKGDTLLFLYAPICPGRSKLSADGVIGDFQSFEISYAPDKYHPRGTDCLESAVTTINFEISNKGIIGLQASGMIYLGEWNRKSIEVVI